MLALAAAAIRAASTLPATGTGGAGWGYGARWGGGMTTSTATTSTINIGTLVLDMYDPAAKQLVWRGTASKTLDAKAKPDKRQKNLAKAHYAAQQLCTVPGMATPLLASARSRSAF